YSSSRHDNANVNSACRWMEQRGHSDGALIRWLGGELRGCDSAGGGPVRPQLHVGVFGCIGGPDIDGELGDELGNGKCYVERCSTSLNSRSLWPDKRTRITVVGERREPRAPERCAH